MSSNLLTLAYKKMLAARQTTDSVVAEGVVVMMDPIETKTTIMIHIINRRHTRVGNVAMGSVKKVKIVVGNKTLMIDHLLDKEGLETTMASSTNKDNQGDRTTIKVAAAMNNSNEAGDLKEGQREVEGEEAEVGIAMISNEKSPTRIRTTLLKIH